MCDNDDRPAVVLHVPHDVKQLVGLLRRQNRSGLVKYQDARSAVERFYDLYGLLFRNRHVVDFFIRVDLKAVPRSDRTDAIGCLFKVELSAGFVVAQNDVFGRSEHIHKLEVLVDHADPGCISIGG